MLIPVDKEVISNTIVVKEGDKYYVKYEIPRDVYERFKRMEEIK